MSPFHTKRSPTFRSPESPMSSSSGKALSVVLVLLLVLAGGGVALVGSFTPDVPPQLPANPTAQAVELLYARPYTLGEAETHWWRAERPQVAAGVALVLRVEDRELVHPRQAAQPVLQVGGQTAERVNHGHVSGHVIALVPAGVDAQGQVDLDLSEAPIFFGDAELPERLDEAQLRARLVDAVAQGVQPPNASVVAQVSESQVHFQDGWELRVWAADLIEAWSPDEADLVAGLRVPRLTR